MRCFQLRASFLNGWRGESKEGFAELSASHRLLPASPSLTDSYPALPSRPTYAGVEKEPDVSERKVEVGGQSANQQLVGRNLTPVSGHIPATGMRGTKAIDFSVALRRARGTWRREEELRSSPSYPFSASLGGVIVCVNQEILAPFHLSRVRMDGNSPAWPPRQSKADQ